MQLREFAHKKETPAHEINPTVTQPVSTQRHPTITAPLLNFRHAGSTTFFPPTNPIKHTTITQLLSTHHNQLTPIQTLLTRITSRTIKIRSTHQSTSSRMAIHRRTPSLTTLTINSLEGT